MKKGQKRAQVTAETRVAVVANKAAGATFEETAARGGVARRTAVDIVKTTREDDVKAYQTFCDAVRKKVMAEAVHLLHEGLLSIQPHELAGLPLEKRTKVLADIARVFRDVEGRDAEAGTQNNFFVHGNFVVPDRMTPEQWREEQARRRAASSQS